MTCRFFLCGIDGQCHREKVLPWHIDDETATIFLRKRWNSTRQLHVKPVATTRDRDPRARDIPELLRQRKVRQDSFLGTSSHIGREGKTYRCVRSDCVALSDGWSAREEFLITRALEAGCDRDVYRC